MSTADVGRGLSELACVHMVALKSTQDGIAKREQGHVPVFMVAQTVH